MGAQRTAADAIAVVHRSEIPARGGEGGGRPFDAHDVLRRFLPDDGVTMRFIRPSGATNVAVRGLRASERTLLVALTGAARVVSGAARTIRAGDVVTIPEGEELTLVSEDDGFEALAIGTSAARDRQPASAEALLALVERRAEAARRGPFFALLGDRALDDPSRRERFFACIQVLSDAFQQVLFARQAACREPQFARMFHTHLLEELGHNELLAKRAGRTLPKPDPVLTATATWFCRRMLVLDNLDKAVLVHFVLEAAGADFHAAAVKAFAGGSTDAYFAAHSEADATHRMVPRDLLDGQDARTYRRLSELVDDGWDMFDAFGRRVVEIVLAEAPS